MYANKRNVASGKNQPSRQILFPGSPEMTSKGRLWEVDSGRPQNVLRTPPRGPSKHVFGTMCGHLFDVPKCLFTFFSELIRLTKSTKKQFNIQGVLE